MKQLFAVGAIALGCMAGAAEAAPTITFLNGGSGSASGTTVQQGFESYSVPANPGYVAIGNGTYVLSNSLAGIGDKPSGATGNFAAVTAGGRYDFTFSQATGVFSFVLGTLDSYNRLIVTYAGGATQQFDGTAIINNMGPLMSDGLVTYMAGSGPLFTGVSFISTTQNSFEFDTISAAVPEPAAWGMMILGFGLVGGVLRRRPTVKVRYA